MMQSALRENVMVVIPPNDEPAAYPGDIKPGYYTRNQVVDLLRKHKDNPEAIQFLADMLEE